MNVTAERSATSTPLAMTYILILLMSQQSLLYQETHFIVEKISLTLPLDATFRVHQDLHLSAQLARHVIRPLATVEIPSFVEYHGMTQPVNVRLHVHQVLTRIALNPTRSALGTHRAPIQTPFTVVSIFMTLPQVA